MGRDEREGQQECAPVEDGAGPRCQIRPERQGDEDEEQHPAEDERASDGCGAEHQPSHRFTFDALVLHICRGRPRDAEVAADETADEVGVLLERGAVDAEPVVRLLYLLAGRVRNVAEQEAARVLWDGLVHPEDDGGEREQQGDGDQHLSSGERRHSPHRAASTPNTRCNASPISCSATTVRKIAALAKIVGHRVTAAGS